MNESTKESKAKARKIIQTYRDQRAIIGLPPYCIPEEVEAVQAAKIAVEKLKALVDAHHKRGRRKGMACGFHCDICEDADTARRVLEVMSGFIEFSVPNMRSAEEYYKVRAAILT